MSPQSLKPRKRPSGEPDWAITLVIGALVVAAAVLVGSLLAAAIYQ